MVRDLAGLPLIESVHVKKRRTIPDTFRKHKVVSVYVLTCSVSNEHCPGGEIRDTYTRVGDAIVTDRKKNPLSYRSGKRIVSYWDVTLRWVLSDAALVAALKGLGGIPIDIKKLIIHPKSELQKQFLDTIYVEQLLNIFGSNFNGHMSDPHKGVIITPPSDVKERKGISHYID
jgi:hypothetical protein